jgi:hypothetical protein
MSASDYLLNIGLLAWILVANLGARPLSRGRLLMPVAVVVAVGAVYLRGLPTAGNDLGLEAAGTAVGVLLGIAVALLVRLRPDGQGGVTAYAGLAFASVWVAVIGGRMLFAYGATHWFPAQIGRFSMTHQITGADAWTAAFVLMALAMVLARSVVTAIQAARIQPAPALR